MDEFTDTTGSLSREAGTTVPTIRLYAKLGLLEFVTAADGTRLFRRGQAERVKAIYASRLARRGHKAA